MPFQCYLFFSACSLYVAFHSLPESPHPIASFQLPPLCRHLQNFFSGLQLPFAICLWNTHYTVLITWISTWSAWTLFWNALRDFYIDDVIKSISFGLLTQICHRAKENESPFKRLDQGLLGCSRQGLPVSSGNSWHSLLCALLIHETHALSLLRFLLIFPEGPWLRVTVTLCLRPCGCRTSP